MSCPIGIPSGLSPVEAHSEKISFYQYLLFDFAIKPNPGKHSPVYSASPFDGAQGDEAKPLTPQ